MEEHREPSQDAQIDAMIERLEGLKGKAVPERYRAFTNGMRNVLQLGLAIIDDFERTASENRARGEGPDQR